MPKAANASTQPGNRYIIPLQAREIIGLRRQNRHMVNNGLIRQKENRERDNMLDPEYFYGKSDTLISYE